MGYWTHQAREIKCGCIFGNFAAEVSEHDEEFRQKVQKVFEIWIEKLQLVLEDMADLAKDMVNNFIKVHR